MAASTAFSAFSVALFCCLFSSAAALRNGSVSAFSRGGRSGTCKSSPREKLPFQEPYSTYISISSSKSSTSSLFYRNSNEEIATSNSSKQIVASTSKRNKRVTKLKPSSTKKKLRRQKLQSYKSAFPASEEDLAHHVQSIFSDNFLEDDDMATDEIEYENEYENENDEECTILSDQTMSHVEYCKKLAAHPALVLNADYQPLRMLPLSTWSWQDSVKAVLSGKAVVVDIYPDLFVRAVHMDMPVPSVIALREYAPTGKARPAFTRRNVFLRDGYRCQYCYNLFRTSDLSLDHVEPRCFGGKLTWENTVTSCRKCNGRKGCLRPSEIHRVGMKLKSKPKCPTIYELSVEANKFVPRRVHPTWAPFLGLEVMVPEKFERGRSDAKKEGGFEGLL
eukprot:CAMPEP_0171330232 /NCGR_PEP_ID=MMETSP0878-20121228/1864_1 /TAXON_ID=67004 /ORGANISM="Thalassiosira weissflogii, Strain CCMP1336" /LENGTH=391 /DNA_ID=CAMNT_0011830479 /DNA_START=229 /DNA_END=1404 /DNA_ORIENTATION=-